MSFWSFMGELALFNMIYKWFSGKPKNSSPLLSPLHTDKPARAGYDACRDEWQRDADRIDELESMLDECDEDSDRYDEILDELDSLEEHVDSLEDDLDMYDDMHDDECMYDDYGSSDFDDFDDDY